MRTARFAAVAAFCIVAVAAPAAAGAAAADPAMVERGRAVFTYVCAPCHGSGRGEDGAPMLPGTHALQLKYKGAKPALIDQRSDLPAPVLKVIVRNGVASMPPLRPTEVSDADIAAIAAYFAENAKARAPAAKPPR